MQLYTDKSQSKDLEFLKNSQNKNILTSIYQKTVLRNSTNMIEIRL